MKKFLRVALLLMLCVSMLTTTCFATMTITCWYAYNNGTATDTVWYASVPLVGRVSTKTSSGFRTQTATALVYGYNKWNNAAFLPFDITSIAYTSSADYNIEFVGGTYEEIKQYFSNLTTNDSGLTEIGNVSRIESITYNGSVKTIFKYSLTNNSSGGTITKIAIVDKGYTDEKYGIIGGHELGHALGWSGHSTLSTQLMYSGATVTSVGTNDKNHIKQFYDEYYGK